MHLTFSLTTMGLLLGDFVQAGPLTLAGCPDAAQIPTEHGFAAWRWAVGYWGIDAKDENGNAIDTAQFTQRIENIPNMIECANRCWGNIECHGLNFFDADKVCILFKHPFALTPKDIRPQESPFVGVAIKGSCAVDGKMVNDVNPVVECCNIWY